MTFITGDGFAVFSKGTFGGKIKEMFSVVLVLAKHSFDDKIMLMFSNISVLMVKLWKCSWRFW